MVEDQKVGFKFLLSPRWLGYYALIIVFSIVCVFLGNWQFDRRDQARAEIERIDNNYDATPAFIEEALTSLDDFDIDAHKWLQVKVTGTYANEVFLARNRVSPSGVGSHVIQPLILDDGTYFFVDRGWISYLPSDGTDPAVPSPAQGRVEAVVRLRQSEQELKNRANVGISLGSIHLPSIVNELGVEGYTGAYGQLVSETPTGDTGLLPPKPERDEGPHLSYALQWYVFILIVLGGAWYAASLEYKSLNGVRPKKPKKKRPLSDAEEEDAFLDGI